MRTLASMQPGDPAALERWETNEGTYTGKHAARRSGSMRPILF